MVKFLVIVVASLALLCGCGKGGEEIAGMTKESIDEMDSMQTVVVSIKYNKKEYKNLEDLIGVVKKPAFNLDCKVMDKDGKIENRKAYIIFSSDKQVKTVEYEDNGAVKITLPAVEQVEKEENKR